jgi:hypothetical protein
VAREYILAEAEPVYIPAVVARVYTWGAASAQVVAVHTLVVVAAARTLVAAGLLPRRAREAREA